MEFTKAVNQLTLTNGSTHIHRTICLPEKDGRQEREKVSRKEGNKEATKKG